MSRTPNADLPALGESTVAVNDFLFAIASAAPDFLPGSGEHPDTFPHAPADAFGIVCPHAGHIRKVNPRDQVSNKGDQFDTLTRRILRRGIPYGLPLPLRPDGQPPADDGVDRGLHFLCYQTSITEQFETLQRDWANSPE